MAAKLAPHAIRVNSLAPGPFDTKMLDHVKQDPATLARHNAQVPLGQPGGGDDINRRGRSGAGSSGSAQPRST